jgi:hypothetical protein
VNVMTDGSVIAPITLAMVGAGAPKPRPAAAPGADEPGRGETIRIPYYEDLEG